MRGIFFSDSYTIFILWWLIRKQGKNLQKKAPSWAFWTKIYLLQIFCKLQQYQRTVLVFAQILSENFTVKVVKAYQALIQLKSMVKTLCCLCWGLKNSGFWMALRFKITFLSEPIGGLFECTVVNFFLAAEKDLLWSRECLKTVIFKYRDFLFVSERQ